MTRVPALAIAVLVCGAGSAVAQQSPAEIGEAQFRKCLPCHSVGEDGADKVGPVLNDVLRQQGGTSAGFFYSPAMVDAGENGLVWTTETLYRFIASPRKTLPGTKMAFAGIRTHEERSNIVAYLRTLSPGYVPPDK